MPDTLHVRKCELNVTSDYTGFHMVEKKEGSLRRVYSLPEDLVDRIIAFQKDKNYPSEVEAVRKLLDEALMYRDDPFALITRFTSKLQSLKIPAEVAKEVLVGHPLVTDISFDREAITFTMTGGRRYQIFSNGKAFEWDKKDGKWLEWLPF